MGLNGERNDCVGRKEGRKEVRKEGRGGGKRRLRREGKRPEGKFLF